MAEMKKISFGFSKFAKKPQAFSAHPPKEEEKIQLIDCVEDSSIKVIGGEKEVEENKPLVIPMKDDNLLRKALIETLKSRKKVEENGVKVEKEDNVVETPVEESAEEKKTLTLDEMAAKEILDELKKDKEDPDEKKVYSVPLASQIGEGESESTLEDYENIPISAFGLAMLRGMGWQPEQGIGKNNKLVKPPSPILRPKGLGLGASALIKNPAASNIPIQRGTYIKVLNGPHKNLYGIVQSLDDVTSRVFVKLAITQDTVSFSEFMLQSITKADYDKFSQIKNIVVEEVAQKKYGLDAIEKKEKPLQTDEGYRRSSHKKSRRHSDSDSDSYSSKHKKSSKKSRHRSPHKKHKKSRRRSRS